MDGKVKVIDGRRYFRLKARDPDKMWNLGRLMAKL